MAIPERLYHYTKRETALEHILPSTTIQLGSLGATNDPREAKEWGFIVLDAPQHLAPDGFLEEMAKLENAANRIRQTEWWVLSLTRNDPDLVVPTPEEPDFSHFKHGYAHPRMWAHYAQNHMGICLEFDGLALHEAIQNVVPPGDDVLCGDVEYFDEFNFERMKQRASAVQVSYPNINSPSMSDGLRAHFRTHYESFFLEKTPDWQTESEFRWLVNSQSGPIRADIRKALTSVIVGTDFPRVYGPCVSALCDKLGVRLERMSWTNRVPHKQPWAAST
jgi:hypothetical protein